MTLLLGGTFNPPHNGHVALAEAARQHYGTDDLTVQVAVRPGHKEVQLPAVIRLQLARAAFPHDRVELEPHERTVDMLQAGRWDSPPVFVIGADQFADFLTWKDPEGVLERARLAVATRPGYPLERLEEVKQQLSRPDRVEFFELEPVPISSREVRDRVARGEPVDDLVPHAVARLIESLGLYRDGGYTSAVSERDPTQN
ncbi:MAG TPA: nicotinate-nicotinamide nucleotide adenylyltransferase [Gaiellaceae bacterium]|nr:nicotinate-nicotinamide nucleotide adenylyltransferase [Gaiellaceae bacterium]